MGEFFQSLLHLDETLTRLIADYGSWVHGIIFGTIFLETGLVIMPFLPGDSLLFAAGLFAHDGSLNIWFLLFALPFASIIGDSVNFHTGKYLGGFFIRKNWIKPHWLDKTRHFYDKHGSKTIILGRFVPIVRTVAPFVAGVEIMPFRRYLPYCIFGSFLWVWICVGAGYLLGQIPGVHENFEKIILAVIALSVVAIIKEVLKDRKERKHAEQEAAEEGRLVGGSIVSEAFTGEEDPNDDIDLAEKFGTPDSELPDIGPDPKPRPDEA